MTNVHDTQPIAVARRTMIAGVGTALLIAELESGHTGLAQTAPGSAPAPSGATAPGKVTLERRSSVLMIGIDRPQAQNRLDPPVLIGLGKAYYELEHDDALRVGVLHGIGPDFSLGIDRPAFEAGVRAGILPPKDPDVISAFGLRPPFRRKPIVVAVQGATKFGAHELFLAADIRVAAADSTFTQGEVTRGVFPGGGATIRFPREVGWGNAMRYMLTGEEWGAEEAYRLGLVQEVTPLGKQLERAVALAETIAAAAPLGVRATLASAHMAIASEDAALQAVGPAFQAILQSEDAREFQRALTEHRAPVFRGT